MIKRYKGKTSVFDIIEADDGHLIMLSDMKEILAKFIGMAIESGADEEKIKKLDISDLTQSRRLQLNMMTIISL